MVDPTKNDLSHDAYFKQPVITSHVRLTLKHLNEVMQIAGSSFSRVWQREDYCFFLLQQNAFNYGVSYEGRVVAYLLSLTVYEVCEVISIATHPDFRRQGFANQLMGALILEETHRSSRILLEVESTNQGAYLLYEKMGFEKISTRKNYYGDKRHALVMQRILSSNIKQSSMEIIDASTNQTCS